jgi:hypothetical protein
MDFSYLNIEALNLKNYNLNVDPVINTSQLSTGGRGVQEIDINPLRDFIFIFE